MGAGFFGSVADSGEGNTSAPSSFYKDGAAYENIVAPSSLADAAAASAAAAAASAATVAATITAAGGLRERLLADRTYYIHPAGSDANNGRSNTGGGAWLTWQHAVDVVHETIDLNGYNVTLQAGGASGTFTGAISVIGPFLGAKSRTSVQFRGDPTTPTNFVLQTATLNVSVITADSGAFFAVSGFRLTSSNNGVLLDMLRGGSILVNGAMSYGPTTSSQIFARRQGLFEATVGYTISGGAAAHIQCNNNATAISSGLPITLTGTPNFTSAFVVSNNVSNVAIPGNTYSGSATGPQARVTNNSVVNTGGAVATIPGNSTVAPTNGGILV